MYTAWNISFLFSFGSLIEIILRLFTFVLFFNSFDKQVVVMMDLQIKAQHTQQIDGKRFQMKEKRKNNQTQKAKPDMCHIRVSLKLFKLIFVKSTKMLKKKKKHASNGGVCVQLLVLTFFYQAPFQVISFLQPNVNVTKNLFNFLAFFFFSFYFCTPARCTRHEYSSA